MTVTLDGKTLNVRGDIRQVTSPVKVEWDKWENQAYKKKRQVFGKIRQWVLSCYEDVNSVTWTNSNAKYFDDIAGNNSSVRLQITAGNLYSMDTYVYIDSVEIPFEPGRIKTRCFFLTVTDE